MMTKKDEIELKKVQDIEYEALVEFSKLCKENNIKYFLRGGSVLGSVKYGGFVPWDDDIDVAIPRKDYDRLIDIVPLELNDKMLFVSYKNTENAHCYFPRIILNKKTVKEYEYPKNNERGLTLIDVLPLDGMPDNKLELYFHILKAYFYRILASLWTIEVKDTKSMHERKMDRILELLHSLKIHKLYKQDDIYRRLDLLYSKYEYGKTRNCGMLASSKLKKEIVPYLWWSDGTKARFRELEVKIPSNYDNYLKQLFGNNYLEYEPTEKDRKKSHLLGEL